MGTWTASRARVQKGLEVEDPANPSGTLSPLTSCATSHESFNLVSLSFRLCKTGVRQAHSSPQLAEHRAQWLVSHPSSVV